MAKDNDRNVTKVAVIRMRFRALLPLVVCAATAGCYGVSHNPGLLRYLKPGGDIVRTHAKPPGRGYFQDFDPSACRLEVVPLESTSPARSQVVLIARVTDGAGEPLKNRRVEWMLEGAGHIIEVDESGYFPGRGYKVDNRYAVSYTDHFEHRIKRTRNPADDFLIRPGQSWCVVTSAVEGDTQVTVYAPEISDWSANRVVVAHHWVDAGFSLPQAVAAKSGQQALLTTNIFRHTDRQPLAGYRVRYRIMDGPAAVLLPGRGPEAIVTSDINGNATVGLMQVEPGLGRNRVFIEILRAPDPSLPSGSALGVARGETTVDWGAPAVSLAPVVPPSINVGQEVPLALTVTNTGKLEAKTVTVRAFIPEGAKYLRSNPPAAVEGNLLVWTLPSVPGGGSKTVEAVFQPAAAGVLMSRARVDTAEGVKDERTATTQVLPAAAPGLKVSLTGPSAAVIAEGPRGATGLPTTFLINVSNPGTSAINKLILRADFDAGLGHASGASKVELPVGAIEAGATKTVPLTLQPLKVGPAALRVRATADGNLAEQAEQKIQVQTAKLTLNLKSSPVRYVGRPVVFDVQVTNAGQTPLGDVAVRDLLPPELSFVSSVPPTAAGREVVWTVGTLQPGESKTVQLTAAANGVTQKTVNIVQAMGYPVVPGDPKPVNLPTPLQAQAEAVVAIQGVPAIRMAVTDLVDPIEVGGRTTYQIQVINQGSMVATQVSVAGVIPPQMRFVAAKGPLPYRVEGQRVIFEPLPSLDIGQSITFTIDVDAAEAGDARFRAELSGANLREPLVKEESTNVR